MKDKDNKNILDYIEVARNKFIDLLESTLESLEYGERIKLDNSILEKLLLKIYYKTENNKEVVDYSEFYSDISGVLLNKLDCTDFKYDNLLLDANAISVIYLTKMPLNPQNIYNKDLSKQIFKGIIFNGSFDGCDIRRSNFDGSYCANIDIAKLKTPDVTGVTFTNTVIKNLTKAKDMEFADFTLSNIKYDYRELNTIKKLMSKNTSLKNAKYILNDNPLELEIRDAIINEAEEQLKRKIIVKTL